MSSPVTIYTVAFVSIDQSTSSLVIPLKLVTSKEQRSSKGFVVNGARFFGSLTSVIF